MRTRRPVSQAGIPIDVESADPAMSTLTRDPHRPGDMSDGHPQLANTTHEQTATVDGQPGVTVRHEDLLVM
jgi:hypothetical protein